MAIINFDATNVQPQQAFDNIPTGWYLGQMIESEMTPTVSGTGSYLACKFEIIAGDFAKRILFDNLNLNNPNPKAVEIAYQTLSAICHAVGVIQCADSQQLHGRPLMIKVGLEPTGVGKDGKAYDARNVIKGYKAAEATPVVQAAPQWAQLQQPVQAPAPFPPQNPYGNMNPNNSAPPAPFPPVQPQQGATPPWAQHAPSIQQSVQPSQTPPWVK